METSYKKMSLSKDVCTQILLFLKPYEILQVSRTSKLIHRADNRRPSKKLSMVRPPKEGLKAKYHLSINHWIEIEKLVKAVVGDTNSDEDYLVAPSALMSIKQSLAKVRYLEKHLPYRIPHESKG